MLNSLNPDQDRRSFGPDLDPICLQSLKAGIRSQLIWNYTVFKEGIEFKESYWHCVLK